MKREKIVFLDRDGVINHNTPGNYIRDITEFRLLPNVKKSLVKLSKAGYEIHIISNQQGVAKKLMSYRQLNEITQLLLERVSQAGGKIDSVNYCTHLETKNCNCRKPKTGLFRQAMEGRKINFKKTWMVGDSWRDIEAGKGIGCRTIWIGDSDANHEKGFLHEGHFIKPDYCVKNLLEAVNLIIRKEKKK